MAAFITVPAQIEAVKLDIQARGNLPPGFDIDTWLQEWLKPSIQRLHESARRSGA